MNVDRIQNTGFLSRYTKKNAWIGNSEGYILLMGVGKDAMLSSIKKNGEAVESME